MKNVSHQKSWQQVAAELESEQLKLKSYDGTLLGRLGNIQDRRILDYGCGPGVLASAMQRLGADVRAYDISTEMRQLCGAKIGDQNIYETAGEIPEGSFDSVICNLVVCIVPEDEVANISGNIRYVMKKGGTSYVGFCNPLMFGVPESALDFRYPTGQSYRDNHDYRKLKKEGNYEIVELHRPIEWYEKVFRITGFRSVSTIFTPEYEMSGRKINDFVIFELEK